MKSFTLNPNEQKAYDWAITHVYTSVAAEYARTLALYIRTRLQPCSWRFVEDHFETSCGQAFWFYEDEEPNAIKENEFGFCPFCGREIIEEKQDEN